MNMISKNGYLPTVNGQSPSVQHGNARVSNRQKPLVEVVEDDLPWSDFLPATALQLPDKKAKLVTKRSARYFETGHAINVRNFDLLRQIVTGFGADYVSSDPTYGLANLNLLYAEANAAIDMVTNKLTVNQETIDLQAAAFEYLKKDATRSKNIFMVSGVPKEAIRRCQHINSNIQGTRIKRLKPSTEDQKHISASHQSYTQQIEHVDAFIELFETYPQYSPPAELTATGWTNKRDTMKTSLQAATATGVDLKFARMHRNVALYSPGKGLVDVAYGVKKVVLGIYGSRSPQYLMVSGIEFTKIRGYKNL